MIDEQVMMAVANGEINKTGILYERYKEAILAYFLSRKLDIATAEDLLHQVFVRLIKYRKSYQDTYIFKPWIFKIARNEFLGYLKDKKVDFVEIENLAIGFEESSGDEEQNLHLALEKLPEEFKEVIMLSRFQGFKYEEISQMLDISVPLIKTRIHRGLKKLRKIYFEVQ